MSEFIKLDDTVRFGVVTYNQSGVPVAADTTPKWYVYEDDTDTVVLTGNFTQRTSLPGVYRGIFGASGVSGFEAFKYYEVHASGTVNSISSKTIIKTFVVDDVFNANIVQVSGTNVETVGDFKADLTSLNDLSQANVRTAVGMGSADLDMQLTSISGDVNGLNGDVMRGTNDAALAATALTDVTWTDAKAGYLDIAISSRASADDLMAVSGQVLDAAGIRTAVGLGAADLDTQLASISGNVTDIYFANIKFISDHGASSEDEYAVTWFKNDQPVPSGDLTLPALSVYDTLDGSALFENQSMNYASPNLGVVRHDEATNVMASGEPYLVVASGTIDSSPRTWRTIIGMDIL